MTDDELKARFIAERGVTQCPPAYFVAVGKIDPATLGGPLVRDAPVNPWKRRQKGRKHAQPQAAK